MPYRNIGRAPLTSLKTELATIGAENNQTEHRFASLERRPPFPSNLVFRPVQNGTIVHRNSVFIQGIALDFAGR